MHKWAQNSDPLPDCGGSCHVSDMRVPDLKMPSMVLQTTRLLAGTVHFMLQLVVHLWLLQACMSVRLLLPDWRCPLQNHAGPAADLDGNADGAGASLLPIELDSFLATISNSSDVLAAVLADVSTNSMPFLQQQRWQFSLA